MTNTRTAWLALSLLAIISIGAMVVMEAGRWRTPAAVDAMSDQPDQKVVQADPVDDNPPRAATEPEAAAREAVNPDPSPILRGAELPAGSPPAAPETPIASTSAAPEALAAPASIMSVTSRHWHDASARTRLTAANAQQIKRARDSKAEMRIKHPKAAANNPKTCAPANGFVSWLRKLNLAPRCPA
jgi:hypothetical protein